MQWYFVLLACCIRMQGVYSGWKMSFFSEFGWKTMGCSPAFAGKAGILLYGPNNN